MANLTKRNNSFPGITFITWEGSPFDTQLIPRNPSEQLTLVKEGRYEDKLYFYVSSRKVNNVDQIVIEMTNGKHSIFGTIHQILGVMLEYYDDNDAVVFKINYFDNVSQPAVANSFDVPSHVFDSAKYLRVQWYMADTPDDVVIGIGASGTF